MLKIVLTHITIALAIIGGWVALQNLRTEVEAEIKPLGNEMVQLVTKVQELESNLNAASKQQIALVDAVVTLQREKDDTVTKLGKIEEQVRKAIQLKNIDAQVYQQINQLSKDVGNLRQFITSDSYIKPQPETTPPPQKPTQVDKGVELKEQQFSQDELT